METRPTKQVIIIRKGICGSRGKEISQGAHASMGALLSIFKKEREKVGVLTYCQWSLEKEEDDAISLWLNNCFTKITLVVETEQELRDLELIAKGANLPHALITDNGKTVFKGIPTVTALAIGPWWSEEIDKITGHLKLY